MMHASLYTAEFAGVYSQRSHRGPRAYEGVFIYLTTSMHVKDCGSTTSGLTAVQTSLARRPHTQKSFPCSTRVKVPYCGSRTSARQSFRLTIAQASGGEVLCYQYSLVSISRLDKCKFNRNQLLREMAPRPNDLSCISCLKAADCIAPVRRTSSGGPRLRCVSIHIGYTRVQR